MHRVATTYGRFTIIPHLVTLDDGIIISLPRVLVDLGEARRLEEESDDESTIESASDDMTSEETFWDLTNVYYVSIEMTLNTAPAA
jgi:hypothetical protein